MAGDRALLDLAVAAEMNLVGDPALTAAEAARRRQLAQGGAAEIDDHLNRGRNMDTRIPQERCAFVL